MPEVDSSHISPEELKEAWFALSDEDRVSGFRLLLPEDAEDFLSHLSAGDAEDLITALHEEEQRKWLRQLPPDDIADIVQEAPEEEQEGILELLDDEVREEARELLEHDEDDAGGLMTPRFARLQTGMTVAEATEYLREQARGTAEQIYYAYVVDDQERLVGVISFRQLVISPTHKRIHEIMETNVVSVPEEMDQEEVTRIFAHEDLYCLPVVDEAGCISGIVTADDILDVVEEEATEDIHKLAASEALDDPYLRTSFAVMLQKRGGWMVVLLLLGFATVEAMSQFEEQLKELLVLSLFVPLIISCGGNTGAQASTLVVRAMALDEVRLRDWLLVMQRECVFGLGLGIVLAVVGLAAALGWNALAAMFGNTPMGPQPLYPATAIAASILCVVLWGTLMGSMLPFILRRCGADPASASAPLVATIVDASGLVIYFTVGGAILRAFTT